MTTWQKDTSYHRTHPTAFPPSWFQRRTQRRCGTSSTTAPSTQSPGKTSRRSQTLDNVSKIYKEWNSSVNSTFDGAITTSAFALETSGRQPSRHAEDYSSQRSCSSD